MTATTVKLQNSSITRIPCTTFFLSFSDLKNRNLLLPCSSGGSTCKVKAEAGLDSFQTLSLHYSLPDIATSLSPLFLSPGNHSSLFHLYHVAISRILYKWNHIVCSLLRLAFSALHNSPKSVQFCVSVAQSSCH